MFEVKRGRHTVRFRGRHYRCCNAKPHRKPTGCIIPIVDRRGI